MEFDAFDEGIALGGLRNRDDIKLMICYLLNKVNKPITKSDLIDAFSENSIANYFEISQAITDLLSNATIDYNVDGEDEILLSTEKSNEIASDLGGDLPLTVREKALNSAIRLMTVRESEKENDVRIESVADGGYNVYLTLKNGEDELMNLKIYTPNSSQAELLKRNYLEDPIKLYSSIVSILTV